MSILNFSKKALSYISKKSINRFGGFFEEKYLRRKKGELDSPPIFIIGVPRTGTTLLYQALIRRFHLAYVPNIAGAYYKAPVFAVRMGKLLLHKNETSFKSNYGRTRGRMAPNEAGSIWNRWYPTEWEHGYNYSTEDTLDKSAKHLMFQTVRGIEEIFSSPFINKNVKHSIRIRSLVDIFPNALFLQMKRDPLRVALSILHGRRENNEDISKWWSVMPKEIDELHDAHYLDQIAGQVYYVEKNILSDIKEVGNWRHFEVTYKDLCTSPRNEINKVREFAENNGLELKIKGEVPKSFKESKSKKNITKYEKKYLRKKLKSLFEDSFERRS